jgi:CubicO group peptidase (beta-lactamase class C family)
MWLAPGKPAVTLRQLLSHQAGLVGFHEPVARELLYDWDAAVGRLAQERPWQNGFETGCPGPLLWTLIWAYRTTTSSAVPI